VETFVIRLRARDGSLIGSPIMTLPAGTQMQWPLAQLFPAAIGKGMTAEFRPVSGLAPVAYAAVADNLSQDPTYYSAASPASEIYLPVITRVHGAGGTFFSSDVSLANTGNTPELITATFLQSDLETATPQTITFTLDPFATRQMDDALGDLSGLSDAYGSLKLESSAAVLAASERISTTSPTTPGTVGEQVDPVTPSGLFQRGSLLGLRQDDAFRSNIGIFNPLATAASVKLVLKAEDGTSLDSATISVPPGRYVQKALPTLFPAALIEEGKVLSIALDAGSSQIFAFASVVDNVSQDPTLYPGLP
jgi:hypothetical protein